MLQKSLIYVFPLHNCGETKTFQGFAAKKSANAKFVYTWKVSPVFMVLILAIMCEMTITSRFL